MKAIFKIKTDGKVAKRTLSQVTSFEDAYLQIQEYLEKSQQLSALLISLTMHE